MVHIAPWDSDFANTAKNLVFGPGFFLLGWLFATVLLRRRRRLRALTTLSFLLGLYCSPLGARWLKHFIEAPNMASQEICSEKNLPIVILGGGLATPTLPTLSSQLRLITGTELMKNNPQAPVVLSGGPTFFRGGDHVESVAYGEFLRLFLTPEKISKHRFFYETQSQNTYQNAAYTREIFEKNHWPLRCQLITSDFHMKRSLMVFQKQGFECCPRPAQAQGPEHSPWLSFWHAEATYQYLNEILGIWGYRFRNWI